MKHTITEGVGSLFVLREHAASESENETLNSSVQQIPLPELLPMENQHCAGPELQSRVSLLMTYTLQLLIGMKDTDTQTQHLCQRFGVTNVGSDGKAGQFWPGAFF